MFVWLNIPTANAAGKRCQWPLDRDGSRLHENLAWNITLVHIS